MGSCALSAAHLCALPPAEVPALCLVLPMKVRGQGGDLYIFDPSQMEMVHRLDAPPGLEGLSSISCLSNILAVEMVAFRSRLPVKPEQLKT